ncbi:hypothetical protein ACCO45_010379 [Purpureocillium lilacinum]|uniref:Uncharacterized protein n=1 Tax=Purpureocillium lilacinum TaxID=33203 RepID=A0ACC4DEY0_PURLI
MARGKYLGPRQARNSLQQWTHVHGGTTTPLVPSPHPLQGLDAHGMEWHGKLGSHTARASPFWGALHYLPTASCPVLLLGLGCCRWDAWSSRAEARPRVPGVDPQPLHALPLLHHHAWKNTTSSLTSPPRPLFVNSAPSRELLAAPVPRSATAAHPNPNPDPNPGSSRPIQFPFPGPRSHLGRRTWTTHHSRTDPWAHPPQAIRLLQFSEPTPDSSSRIDSAVASPPESSASVVSPARSLYSCVRCSIGFLRRLGIASSTVFCCTLPPQDRGALGLPLRVSLATDHHRPPGRLLVHLFLSSTRRIRRLPLSPFPPASTTPSPARFPSTPSLRPVPPTYAPCTADRRIESPTMPSRLSNGASHTKFELPALNLDFGSITDGTNIPPPPASPVQEVPTPPQTPPADKKEPAAIAKVKPEAAVPNGTPNGTDKPVTSTPPNEGRSPLTANGSVTNLARPESRGASSVVDDRKSKRSSGWFRRLRGGDPKRSSLIFEDAASTISVPSPKKPSGPLPR